VGGALFGLNAEAWEGGPQLQVFVVSNPRERPVVCVLGGGLAHCNEVNCADEEKCRHLLGILSKQSLPLTEHAIDGGRSEASGTLAKRQVERHVQREAGIRRLLVCNDPVCRRPEFKLACTHQATFELWDCSPAASFDKGHSHRRVDTVMSRGGGAVTSLCESWGEEGISQRNEAQYFCAPRLYNPLTPCGRAWKLESRKGSLFTAGAHYQVIVYRRVCRIAPGRKASCCSIAYDGKVSPSFQNHSRSRGSVDRLFVHCSGSRR
jgi:hypothetical protein